MGCERMDISQVTSEPLRWSPSVGSWLYPEKNSRVSHSRVKEGLFREETHSIDRVWAISEGKRGRKGPRLWGCQFSFGSAQSLSRVRLCNPMNRSMPASVSITTSRSLLKLMPIESVMPSSHLILCRPLLLLPPTPPSIRVFFPMSQLFASGGQSIGVSASTSVLPMNTQD